MSKKDGKRSRKSLESRTRGVEKKKRDKETKGTVAKHVLQSEEIKKNRKATIQLKKRGREEQLKQQLELITKVDKPTNWTLHIIRTLV